jgi:hypothetical protein
MIVGVWIFAAGVFLATFILILYLVAFGDRMYGRGIMLVPKENDFGAVSAPSLTTTGKKAPKGQVVNVSVKATSDNLPVPSYVKDYSVVDLPLSTLYFTNNEKFQVTIQSMKIAKTGDFPSYYFSNLKLVDSTGRQVGLTVVSLFDDVAMFDNLNFPVPANSKQVLTVQSGVGYVNGSFVTQGTIGFGVSSTESVVLGPDSLNRKLVLDPKQFPQLNMLPLRNGGLDARNRTTMSPAGQNQTIARWDFTTHEKSVNLQGLMVINKGDFPAKVTGFYYDQDQQTNLLDAQEVILTPGASVFLPLKGREIVRNQTEGYILRADTTGAKTNQTVEVEIGDIQAVDASYGVRLFVDPLPVQGYRIIY